jgi:hypothetical protein
LNHQVYQAVVGNGKPNNARPVEASDPMPFGKHKGLPIETIPRDYLVWCLQKADVCNPDSDRYWPEFRELCESMVGPHATVKPPPMNLLQIAEHLIREGITLTVQGDRLVASGPIDPAVSEAIGKNAGLIGAILQCSGGRAATPEKSPHLILGEAMRGMVKAWFSRMSRRFHPDHGGSVAAQSAINQGYQGLLEIITAWEEMT